MRSRARRADIHPVVPRRLDTRQRRGLCVVSTARVFAAYLGI